MTDNRDLFHLNWRFMTECAFRKLDKDDKDGIDMIDKKIIRDRSRKYPILG